MLNSVTQLGVALVVLLSTQADAWAAGTPVPCTGTESGSLTVARLKHSGALKACESPEGKEAFKARLVERVREQVKKYYEGKDPAWARPTKMSQSEEALFGDGKDKSFMTPICSLKPNLFTEGRAERASNHMGQSCGQAYEIRRSGRKHRKWFPWAGAGTSRGTWEAALMRGAFIDYTAASLEKVKGEIDRGSLGTRTIPSKMVARYNGLYDRLSAQSAAYSKDLQSMSNPDEMAKCDPSREATSQQDADGNRQMICHLQAAREATEAGFLQLAVFSVFAESGQKYRCLRKDLYDPNLGTLKPKYRSMLVSQCKSGRGNRSVQQCYEDKYVEFLNDRYRAVEAGGVSLANCD
jgi:hypothetical protein